MDARVMIRRCVWCRPAHIIGQVEPLHDHGFTDGMCAAAAARENIKLDRLLADRVVVPTRSFFMAAAVMEPFQKINARGVDMGRVAACVADLFYEAVALVRFFGRRLIRRN